MAIDRVQMWSPHNQDTVIMGQYTYTIIDETNHLVKATATSKELTNYDNVPSSISINGQSYSVISMEGCYEGCANLVSAPAIPNSVTSIDECFKECVSLTTLSTAIIIPSSVNSMNSCFEGCVNLTCNIEVYNTPNSYNNIFIGTSRPIFIIHKNSADITIWKDNICANYSNIHYEAVDNPVPRISVAQVTRGEYNDGQWVEDDTADDVRVELSAFLPIDLLPYGWVNNFMTNFTLTINHAPVRYIVDPQSEEEQGGVTYYKNPLTLYIQNYENSGTVFLSVTDFYNHTSAIRQEYLYNIFVMLDFIPGGQGMSIGRAGTRNGLDIAIPTTIGEGLIPPKNGSDEVDLSKPQLVIGRYNIERTDADFIVGGGSSTLRRNSFEIKNGGLYSYDDNNTPVMQIETTADEIVFESYTESEIQAKNYTFNIANINLNSSRRIDYNITYISITTDYVITEDTVVVDDKVYYEKINDDEYEAITNIDPSINPHEQSYYEQIQTTETYYQNSDFAVDFEYSHYENLMINNTSIGNMRFDMTSSSITVVIDRENDLVERILDITINYPTVVLNYISYNFGKYLNNSRQLQFTMGQYNDNKNSNLLEIGNGTDNNNRKNVLAVTEAGHLEITGALRPANNIQRGGVSYIDGARGTNALIYAPKSTSNQWTPTLVQRTKGQGSWQIGNFSDETLEFIYATKTNIDSQTNTVTELHFNPDGGITIPKTAHFDIGTGYLYQSTWSNTDNIYYNTPGYHSFYTNGAGRLYIYDDRVDANVKVHSSIGFFGSGANITSINASNISSGTIADARIPANILRKSELVAQTFTKSNISIPANTTANGGTALTLSCAKSGYTPICIVNAYTSNANSDGANTSWCNIFYGALSGTTISFHIRNYNSTVAAKVDAHFTVLFKES